MNSQVSLLPRRMLTNTNLWSWPAPHQPRAAIRVVIIGSGFGGLNAAKALKRADVDITLVAKTTSHLFQPLLYQLATGILSAGDIAPTTRLILKKNKNCQVLLGDVEDIDLTNKTVTSELMSMETVLPFDSLIVAAGAQQNYFGHEEFATFAPGMKNIDDALELRGRILGAFEAAEVTTDPAERAAAADVRHRRRRADRGGVGRPDRRTGPAPCPERSAPSTRPSAGCCCSTVPSSCSRRWARTSA